MKLSSKKKNFPDYFKGFIAMSDDVTYDAEKNTYKINSEKNMLSKIEGEWSRYLSFDGKEYWRQGENKTAESLKQEYHLPSDSQFREDTILLKHGYDEDAQQAKTFLEERQRKDKKL